jgi:DNA-directed RNA polymerase subunit RPC12/RpoP
MTRGQQGGHPGKRLTKKLRVIPEPTSPRAILAQSEGETGPLITGTEATGSIDYICGTCGRLLIEGLDRTQGVANAVILCPGCGSYNETGGVPEFN